jgi:pimeloyl-ACP methyl ester carboxylesterase
MKPRGRYIGRNVRFSLVLRLQAAAVCLLLLVAVGARPASAMAPRAFSGAETAHVYLLRGVLNIFSLGLDDIAAKLRAQGIPVTVANFVSWSSLADDAAAGYKSGRIKTIILVGHSSGATALPDMVAKLGQLGVPVKLAIGLDSVFRTKLSGNAERYINFYIANGAGEPVTRTKDFHGQLDNVDVHTVPGVGHITIEKNQIMQQKVIGAIDSVVFGRAASPQARAARPDSDARAAAATLRN